MTENRKPMPRDFDDEVPDLSAPEWQAAFAKAPCSAGGPVPEPEGQHDGPAQPGGPGAFPRRRPRLADPHRRDAAQGRWYRSLTLPWIRKGRKITSGLRLCHP